MPYFTRLRRCVVETAQPGLITNLANPSLLKGRRPDFAGNPISEFACCFARHHQLPHKPRPSCQI
jgi:hypothetical protein